MQYKQVYDSPMEWLEMQMKSIDTFVVWDTQIETEHSSTWPIVVSIDRAGRCHQENGDYLGSWDASDDAHSRWVPVCELSELAECEGSLSPLERRVRDGG